MGYHKLTSLRMAAFEAFSIHMQRSFCFPPSRSLLFFRGEGAAGWFSHNDCSTKNVSAKQKDLCPPGGVEDNQWCNAECPACKFGDVCTFIRGVMFNLRVP